MTIKLGSNQYLIDFIKDGYFYMRPVRDGVAFLPGVRVEVEELKRVVKEKTRP